MAHSGVAGGASGGGGEHTGLEQFVAVILSVLVNPQRNGARKRKATWVAPVLARGDSLFLPRGTST